ncbi:hypothetical protein U27_05606 [Candidatus Vecturithrix granuli]|uniref:Uncharacterized protein n=1 Tax=Vecturithrix granuli TaxID=1499967 RepID=A0A081C227_VECG1|nr:hypothetical protein U27_05606 [Candidatus Vecturithrix granuli]
MNWKIQEINVRLEFAIQAYEAAQSFPIAAGRFESTDTVDDDMLNNAVLGLQFMEAGGNRSYILYRRDDLSAFKPETMLKTAIRINFTAIEPANPDNCVEGTTYYPILQNEDHLCPTIPDKPWSFLLLKEDTEYRLIHIRPIGPGPGGLCSGCYDPYISPERWWECLLNGCYGF